MKTNSFDARAITQPGGMYASINDGLLQSLMAYLQFKDRERAGERQIVRDDRAAARQALLDQRDGEKADLQKRYIEAQIGPSTALTAASSTTEIANAVVEAEIDALETYNRTSNTAATITGPVNGATTLTITTDAAYEPIKSIS
jgi:hypothetical protein